MTEVPVSTQKRHHRRLATLGVVSRIQRVLVSPHGAARVTELLAWVETELDGGTIAVFVKASYLHQPHSLRGQKAEKPYRTTASFRVELGRPFGPIVGFSPLPDRLVQEIYALGGVTLSLKA